MPMRHKQQMPFRDRECVPKALEQWFDKGDPAVGRQAEWAKLRGHGCPWTLQQDLPAASDRQDVFT
jgi:hypothetical protein